MPPKQLDAWVIGKKQDKLIMTSLHVPLILYAHMNSGVHWLFFSFLTGGGALMSSSSIVCTNISSGYKLTFLENLHVYIYSIIK